MCRVSFPIPAVAAAPIVPSMSAAPTASIVFTASAAAAAAAAPATLVCLLCHRLQSLIVLKLTSQVRLGDQ